MDWVRIVVADVQDLAAHPSKTLGAWLRLLAYCARKENGGTIPGAHEWSPTRWQRETLLTGFEVASLVSGGLAEWTPDGSLSAKYYPGDDERALHKRRRDGQLGGRPVNQVVNQVDQHHADPDQSKSKSKRSDPPSPPLGGALVSASRTYPAGFETAWAAYPRIRGTKHEAAKVWLRQRPDPNAVMAGISAWKRCPDWTKDSGRFIPAMSTWLNRRAWETPPGNGVRSRFPTLDELQARERQQAEMTRAQREMCEENAREVRDLLAKVANP